MALRETSKGSLMACSAMRMYSSSMVMEPVPVSVITINVFGIFYYVLWKNDFFFFGLNAVACNERPYHDFQVYHPLMSKQF